MSAGFFLFLTVPRPKNMQLFESNQWRKKRIVKSLIVAVFIPLLWLETASEFLNKANTIMLLNFSTVSGLKRWNINGAANSNTLVEELIT